LSIDPFTTVKFSYSQQVMSPGSALRLRLERWKGSRGSPRYQRGGPQLAKPLARLVHQVAGVSSAHQCYTDAASKYPEKAENICLPVTFNSVGLFLHWDSGRSRTGREMSWIQTSIVIRKNISEVISETICSLVFASGRARK
jgi:hypothetical protein